MVKNQRITNQKRINASRPTYVSNPFKLVFQGMDIWLKYNQLLAVLVIAATFVGTFMNFLFSFEPRSVVFNNANDSKVEILQLVILLLIIFASIALTTIYNGMVAYIGLQTIKKTTVTLVEALQAAINKFWTVLLAELIVFLKVVGGLFLFIIPGVRAALRYSIVNFYIFDKNSNATEAIRSTKELTKDHLIEVFGMHTAAGIVPVVGGLLLAGGQTQMYNQLTKLKKSKQPKPPIHWLNYIGIVLVFAAMIIIMMILIIAIIALAQLSELSK